MLVPACHYCNNFKGRRIFRSLGDARAYLKPLTDEYRRVEAQETALQEEAAMVERRTVKCANCGRLVDARRPHRKYCTPECRMAAWWKRKLGVAKADATAQDSFGIDSLPEPE